jgi:hypothetical protein
MSALNTNYGGPTQTQTSTPKGSKFSKSSRAAEEGLSLSSLSRRRQHQERLPSEDDLHIGKEDSNAVWNHNINKINSNSSSKPDPELRWDEADYRVTVVSGDERNTSSGDSQRMIISKNTEWQVEFRDNNNRLHRASTP